MLNQYGAQLCKGFRMYGPPQRIRGKLIYPAHPMARHRVGTVPVGTIVYIQDGIRPFSNPGRIVKRNPWIVRAWLNREYFPCVQGKPNVTYMRGGHLAIVESLRDGRIQPVADWLLLRSLDA